ncbi:MAG TPA: DUF1801 domain-containing protein [Flavobacteriales bacterium]|nr:DUF1801 domain-containing protein [Flavobacteriales bacterium]
MAKKTATGKVAKKSTTKKAPATKKPAAKKPAKKVAELKTQKTTVNPVDFIKKLVTGDAQKDSLTILSMMEKATGDKPKMWGGSIIGYGDVHLKYPSGRELDWFKIGFSPRKANLTLYVLNGSADQNKHLKKLGKFTTGKGCLYIKSLADVDQKALEGVIKTAIKK